LLLRELLIIKRWIIKFWTLTNSPVYSCRNRWERLLYSQINLSPSPYELLSPQSTRSRESRSQVKLSPISVRGVY